LLKQLQALAQPDALEILRHINRGIEKESLRITPQGKLAQSPHPQGLGSALCHKSITTDYSEALLEFITPVSNSIEDTMRTLEDIHSLVYQEMGEDILWSTSMPCIVTGDDSIPVAQYGSSNVAQMKTAYRYGLGHRYGRLMQAIAGIHYNWSMPQRYWDESWKEAGSPGNLSDYISNRYLGLIRNFKRYSWLLIYLFGASPAVCASFLRGRDDHQLQPFDDTAKSLHLPYGTSLRMGDLGYNSDAQKDLSICYNSLENYVDTLRTAILQPHAAYQDIPAGDNGDYQQLSDSLLQIENEFYSPIRPKRVAQSGETALSALVRAGIEYIEVRCIDVSPFHPLGMDEEQIRFMDTFLLFCLLEESPPCDEAEQATQASNLEAVVNRGRQPGLTLHNGTKEVPLQDWATQLVDKIHSVADVFDTAFSSNNYSESALQQAKKIDDPEQTPSARVLREMKEKNLPFFRLAMAYSEQWSQHFKQRGLDSATQTAFNEEAERSLAAQHAIESSDEMHFSDYLKNYFSQYQAL